MCVEWTKIIWNQDELPEIKVHEKECSRSVLTRNVPVHRQDLSSLPHSRQPLKPALIPPRRIAREGLQLHPVHQMQGLQQDATSKVWVAFIIVLWYVFIFIYIYYIYIYMYMSSILLNYVCLWYGYGSWLCSCITAKTNSRSISILCIINQTAFCGKGRSTRNTIMSN